MSWKEIRVLFAFAVLFCVVAAPTLWAAVGGDVGYGTGGCAVQKDPGDNLAAMGLLAGMTVIAIALTALRKRR
jgi:hypothetical protein